MTTQIEDVIRRLAMTLAEDKQKEALAACNKQVDEFFADISAKNGGEALPDIIPMSQQSFRTAAQAYFLAGSTWTLKNIPFLK